MRVVTLASSSKGNCTLVWTESTKILIDIGITCSECEMKLKALGIEPKDIDVILNTHKHGDHTKGITAFARKYGTRIYVHIDGRDELMSKLGKVDTAQVFAFDDRAFQIGDMTVQSFKVPHDVECCVGYSITCGKSKFSYVTDIGHMTDEVMQHLMGSKLVEIEANHNKEMLIANQHYTPILKTRILSKNGHLCNDDTAVAVAKLALSGTKQVILAHLSEENNTPEIAYRTVVNYLAKNNIAEGVNIKIDVADPYKIGTIFNLVD